MEYHLDLPNDSTVDGPLDMQTKSEKQKGDTQLIACVNKHKDLCFKMVPSSQSWCDERRLRGNGREHQLRDNDGEYQLQEDGVPAGGAVAGSGGHPAGRAAAGGAAQSAGGAVSAPPLRHITIPH